jgi:hypothetical protein
MPAVNRANHGRLLSGSLHECHSLAVRLSSTNVPWRHLVVAEEASCLDDSFGEVVGPLRHVVLQVGLDLIESAIV